MELILRPLTNMMCYDVAYEIGKYLTWCSECGVYKDTNYGFFEHNVPFNNKNKNHIQTGKTLSCKDCRFKYFRYTPSNKANGLGDNTLRELLIDFCDQKQLPYFTNHPEYIEVYDINIIQCIARYIELNKDLLVKQGLLESKVLTYRGKTREYYNLTRSKTTRVYTVPKPRGI